MVLKIKIANNKVIRDNQVKRSSPRFVPMGYNGDLRFIIRLRTERYRLKLKQSTKNTICFLDKVSFGENELNVRKILGEPFLIYRNFLSDLPHTVYSYRLKSGSNKIKVELHFVEKSFFLGIIFYHTKSFNHSDLNHYFKADFGLDDFHFIRDIIVDPLDNFIEFHLDPDHFTMTYSKMKWIDSTKILQDNQLVSSKYFELLLSSAINKSVD